MNDRSRPADGSRPERGDRDRTRSDRDTRAAPRGASPRASAQEEAIAAGLADVWESGGRRFLTVELTEDGAPDPDRFVQWIDGQWNMRWPRSDDPESALPRLGVPLPRGARITDHAADGTCVVGAWDVRPADTAAFFAAYVRRVLARGPRWDVDVRVES